MLKNQGTFMKDEKEFPYIEIKFTSPDKPGKSACVLLRKTDNKVFAEITKIEFLCCSYDGAGVVITDEGPYVELEWWLKENIKEEKEKQKIIKNITKSVRKVKNDPKAEIFLEKCKY